MTSKITKTAAEKAADKAAARAANIAKWQELLVLKHLERSRNRVRFDGPQ